MRINCRKMLTGSNNPMWVFFANRDIGKPLFILQEFEMAELKFDILNESKEIQKLNDINFKQFYKGKK